MMHQQRKPLLFIGVACLAAISLWRVLPVLLHLISVQGIWSLAFSPDGKSLAAGGCWEVPHAGGTLDGYVRVWDTQTGQQKLQLTSLSSNVNWLAYSPDARSLATWQQKDKKYCLWDSETGKLLNQSQVAAIAPTTKQWLSEDEMGKWQVKMEPLRKVEVKLPKYSVPLAISANSRVVVFATDKDGIQIWNLATQKLQTKIKREGSSTQATALSSDGSILAIKSSDKAGYELWDGKTGQLLRRLKSQSYNKHIVIFSPDDTKLATEDFGGLIEIWDARSGRLLRTIQAF